MKSFFTALIGAILVLCGAAQLAKAADAVAQGAIYATTFVEVTPGAAAQTVAMLKEYRDATRKERARWWPTSIRNSPRHRAS